MKNKRLLAILAFAAAASMLMSGCGFGGDEPEEQVEETVTPTPICRSVHFH